MSDTEEVPRPIDEPVPEQNAGLLESWKEIAAYLNRGVRTVQRWERNEALPVHRHVHDKRGTVYAFRREIDQWRENRRKVNRRPAGGDGSSAPSGWARIAEVLRKLFPRYFRARVAARVAALILLALVVIVAWVRAQGVTRPVTVGNTRPNPTAGPQPEMPHPAASSRGPGESSRPSSDKRRWESNKRRTAESARQ